MSIFTCTRSNKTFIIFLKFLYKYKKRRTTARRTIKTTTTVTAAAAGVIIKLKGVYFL